MLQMIVVQVLSTFHLLYSFSLIFTPTQWVKERSGNN